MVYKTLNSFRTFADACLQVIFFYSSESRALVGWLILSMSCMSWLNLLIRELERAQVRLRSTRILSGYRRRC